MVMIVMMICSHGELTEERETVEAVGISEQIHRMIWPLVTPYLCWYYLSGLQVKGINR